MNRCQLKFHTSIALLLLSSGVAHQAHATAEESCDRNPNRMNMVVQLTRTGQEKISQLAYEIARRGMDDNLKLVPPSPPAFGADPKICKRPDIDHLSQSEIKAKSFGLLPEALWNGNIPNVRMDRNEPIQMKMDGLKIKHIAMAKNPSIKCQGNVCEVDTMIDELNMGFDIAAKSVNENCNQIELNNVKVTSDPLSIKKKPILVHVKFRFTENLAHPIEVVWNDSNVTAPVDSIQYQAQSVTQDKNLCQRNKGIQKAAADIIGDLVAKNQYVTNMILDIVKTSVIEDFANEEITQLAKANGVGKETLVTAAVPKIKDITNESTLKAATQDQIGFAEKYLKKVQSARTSAELSDALKSDSVDSQINDYLASFKNSNLPTSPQFAKTVADQWATNAQVLTQLAANTQDPSLKTLLQNERNKIEIALTHIDQFQRNLKVDVQMPTDGDKIALMLTAIQANNLQSEIEAKVSACYKCQKFNIPGTAGAEWGFDKGSHDLAVKTGYGTINQALAIMNANHALDTCIIQGAKRDCKDARPDDVKIDVHFNNAPEVIWDPESGSFAMKISQVQLNNHKGKLGAIASSMKVDIILPGTLTVQNGGKSVHFTPIQDHIRVSNPDFKPADWDRTQLLSGVVAWAAEKMANTAFAHRMMQKALTTDVTLPEYATLSQIKPTPQGFSVYANLPDDPTTLLPPENGNRTLAGTKRKLN